MRYLVFISLMGCSAQPISPSCSDTAYHTQLIDCASRAAQCVKNNGSESKCGKICDKEWADWQDRCQ